MLTFDAPTHTYRWKGVVVPSVTQLLGVLADWSRMPADVLAAAQLRGSDVHLMTQWHDEDRLELSEFTPEVQSYLPAWQAFLRDYEPNWLHIETMGFHERLGYAGTPDREGVLKWMDERGLAEFVIDIKTGAPHPLHGLQTAGYEKFRGADRRRATVHLQPDGRYKFREWPDPNDWPTFLSLLTVRTWTSKHL